MRVDDRGDLGGSAERDAAADAAGLLDGGLELLRERLRPRTPVSLVKTTLPLAMYVRTSRQPAASYAARRSAIAIRLFRPRLIPRSSATQT